MMDINQSDIVEKKEDHECLSTIIYPSLVGISCL